MPRNPVLVTASEVRAATKERCYDYGLIALALSDPAIQTLMRSKFALDDAARGPRTGGDSE